MKSTSRFPGGFLPIPWPIQQESSKESLLLTTKETNTSKVYSWDENEIMSQPDVTRYHIVKCQVCGPESKSQKGHHGWKSPRKLQGRGGSGTEGGLSQREWKGTSVLSQNTWRASHLDFQYYFQMRLYGNTKIHRKYWEKNDSIIQP